MVSSLGSILTSPLKKTRQIIVVVKISQTVLLFKRWRFWAEYHHKSYLFKNVLVGDDFVLNQVDCRSEKCALIGPGMKERQKGMLDYFGFGRNIFFKK